jgi:hypothetical protein
MRGTSQELNTKSIDKSQYSKYIEIEMCYQLDQPEIQWWEDGAQESTEESQ